MMVTDQTQQPTNQISLTELFSATPKFMDEFSTVVKDSIDLPINSLEEVCLYLDKVINKTYSNVSLEIKLMKTSLKKADFYIDETTKENDYI